MNQHEKQTKAIKLIARIESANRYIFSGNYDADELAKATADRNELVAEYLDLIDQLVADGCTEQFADKVMTVAEEDGVQLRYATFMVATGSRSVKGRGAEFMGFISDVKALYMRAHPEQIYCGGHIGCHDHFTSYIVSGEWLEAMRAAHAAHE